MELYLIRHGETDGNVKNHFIGWSNIPLNDHGMDQAEEVAGLLAPRELKHIYSSPSLRAAMTANVCCWEWGLSEAVLDDDWRERSFGLADSMTPEEFSSKHPGVREEWEADPFKRALPDGETGEALYARVSRAIARLYDDHANDSVVVVTHWGAIAYALCHLLDGSPKGYWNYPLEHCGFVRLEVDRDKGKLLEAVGQGFEF